MSGKVVRSENPPDKFITISQHSFKLRLWKREGWNTEFEVIAEYPVAVGLKEYPTPNGIFCMLTKVKNPDWQPPDQPWVGPDLREENGVPIIVSSEDPNNPIRECFLDLGDGIGIHGTLNLDSLGTRASHGCIRVSPDDANELYRRVPAGTIVRIY